VRPNINFATQRGLLKVVASFRLPGFAFVSGMGGGRAFSLHSALIIGPFASLISGASGFFQLKICRRHVRLRFDQNNNIFSGVSLPLAMCCGFMSWLTICQKVFISGVVGNGATLIGLGCFLPVAEADELPPLGSDMTAEAKGGKKDDSLS
jgi:hypothetical protein